MQLHHSRRRDKVCISVISRLQNSPQIRIDARDQFTHRFSSVNLADVVGCSASFANSATFSSILEVDPPTKPKPVRFASVRHPELRELHH